MGASIEGRDGGRLPPLSVRGGGLHGITYRTPVPSAQVKSAVLLAGLGAEGDTVVEEDVPTRAHTEELLARFGADVAGERWGDPGAPLPARAVRLHRPRRPVTGCLLGGGGIARPGQ